MTTKEGNDFSICEIFREWFAENKRRFNQECRIRYYKNREYNHVEIDFVNVAQEIRCWVNEGSVLEIAARHEGKIVDYIIDLECLVCRGKNRKYYCGFCLEPKYYNTPKELVIEHTYEYFLAWANEKFTADHVLKLEYYLNWGGSKIITRQELLDNPIEEQTDGNAVLIIPVIKGDGVPVMYGDPMSKAEKADFLKRQWE